eukprot:COSAG02_NODE_13347_length_1406_cov_1.892119_1_plen_101_part_10
MARSCSIPFGHRPLSIVPHLVCGGRRPLALAVAENSTRNAAASCLHPVTAGVSVTFSFARGSPFALCGAAEMAVADKAITYAALILADAEQDITAEQLKKL